MERKQKRLIEDKRGNNDARLDFESLVNALPPKQAEVMELKREGQSLAEIASNTGESLGTVRGRYRLAKGKLKKPRKKPRREKTK